jgi:hypothetical protein
MGRVYEWIRELHAHEHRDHRLDINGLHTATTPGFSITNPL